MTSVMEEEETENVMAKKQLKMRSVMEEEATENDISDGRKSN